MTINTNRVHPSMNSDTNRSLSLPCDDAHTLCMTQSKKTAEAIEAGRRIRAARGALNLSLAALAELSGGGLTGSRIGNYEQGTREVDIFAARLLAKALAVHPAYLMGLLSEEEHRFLKALNQSSERPFPAPPPRLVVPAKHRASRS